MKKIIMPIVIGIVLILFIGLWPDKKNTDLKKITVSEVAHSIFYAPMYVAKDKEFFKEYGLDVEFILANGADKVTAGVLSGDVEIGFCGSESTLYVYNQKEKDYLINFAGLTKKDGSFIVSRNKDEKFKVSNLKGKHIIAGREGGMPAMTLEWTLSENGIKKSDLNFDTSVAFAAMSGAFIGGVGDYVALFEPTASELEKNGYGKIVASLGELGGVVPYTSFIAKKSYIENNKDVIKNFTKAINKGLEYALCYIVLTNIGSELASTLVLIFFLPKNIKIKKDDLKPNKIYLKEELSIAIPNTTGRLIGSIGYFLEPIILTSSIVIPELLIYWL